ncbi:MAG TPA: LysM peptidoglycan-binding domain-containing protein [Anaerolineales bacterium]
MTEIKAGPKLAAFFLLGALLLSACQQSVSNVPQATSTPIAPTGLFVTPLTGQNPMEMIEKFAQGTAAAQTAEAGGGTPTTPQPISTIETSAASPTTAVLTSGTGTVIPTSGVIGTSTPSAGTTVVGTAATSVVTTPVIVGTLPTQGPKPSSYTLQKGEFPYCIARRFNVNPSDLLSINGLVDGELYYPNLTLKIPSTGSFPGDRSLHTHPTTFTVASSNTSIYEVACYFGDVDPAQIAAANGISVSSALTSGQKLAIP